MTKGRIEAFSEGVIAIIVTIMGLDMLTPSAVPLAFPHLGVALLAMAAFSATWIVPDRRCAMAAASNRND